MTRRPPLLLLVLLVLAASAGAALVVGLFPQSTASAAETLSAGTCREVTCPCTDAQKRAGMVDTGQGCKPVCDEADQRALRDLIAELRDLKQQADFIRADYRRKQTQRRDAASRLMGCGATDDPPSRWCNGGSIKGFFSGMGGLFSELPGVGQAYGTVMDVTDVATSPAQWDSWAGAASGQLASDEFADSMVQRAVEEARGYSEEYLKRTGDARGASEIFSRRFDEGTRGLGGVQIGGKLLSIGLSLYGAYDGAATLGSDLGDWYYAGKEEAALEAELERIDARIEEILAQIAAIRARCHDPALGPGRTAGGAGDRGSNLAALAGGGPASLGTGGVPQRQGTANRDFLPRAKRALDVLTGLEGHLERAIGRVEAELLPRFAPLVVRDLWTRMSPPLVRHLARSGGPHLLLVKEEAERAVGLSREIEAVLRGER